MPDGTHETHVARRGVVGDEAPATRVRHQVAFADQTAEHAANRGLRDAQLLDQVALRVELLAMREIVQGPLAQHLPDLGLQGQVEVLGRLFEVACAGRRLGTRWCRGGQCCAENPRAFTFSRAVPSGGRPGSCPPGRALRWKDAGAASAGFHVVPGVPLAVGIDQACAVRRRRWLNSRQPPSSDGMIRSVLGSGTGVVETSSSALPVSTNEKPAGMPVSV